MYLAKIHVTLKKSVQDPQGVAISEALHHLGYQGVNNVRMGKYLEIKVQENGGEDKTRADVDAMCQKLLANTVIEHYEYTLEKI